jgi:glycosyltransferase involved in cell wall biosynthesis
VASEPSSLRRLGERLRRLGAAPSVELLPGELERLAGVFDAEWYLADNPDVAAAGLDPWGHFESRGVAEGRIPTPLFDPPYFARHAAVPRGTPAFLHYLRVGDEGARTASALFNVEWLRAQLGEDDGTTLLERYLRRAPAEALSPNRLLSPAWMLEQLGAAGLQGRTPLEHYVLGGPDGPLDPHPWFSNAAYRRLQADLHDSAQLPLAHFLEWGGAQRRRVQPYLELAAEGALADAIVASPLGPCAVTVLDDVGVPPWHADEPLIAHLRSHLDAAHRRTVASLCRDASGHLGIDWEARAAALELPSASDARVLVVLPVLGDGVDALRCLESIARATDRTPIEVLAIDDGTDERRTRLLDAVDGVQLMAGPPGADLAAHLRAGWSRARDGQLVALLGEHVEVLDGWLDEAVEHLDAALDVAAMSPMVLGHDLAVDWAGAALDEEGALMSVGRGADPLAAAFNLIRPLPAAPLVPLVARPEALGESDRLEDAGDGAVRDLAVFDRALRYLPSSEVLHRRPLVDHAPGSGGDSADEPLGHGTPEEAADPLDHVHVEPFAGRCVLVVDHRLPQPQHDSGSQRMLGMLRGLKQAGLTPVVLSAYSYVGANSARQLSEEGIGVLSLHLADPDLPPLLDRILPRIDFAVLSRPHVARDALEFVARRYPDAPVVFDSVDALALRAERRHALEGSADSLRDLEEARALERQVVSDVDLVLALSEEDRRALEDLVEVPPRFVIVPNVHEVRDAPPGPAGRSGLLFVGGYEHAPNVDAVRWFVAEVLPLIDEQVGHVEVTLAGSKPTEEVLALASERIHVPGWVEDLSDLYDSARVVIAPLRYGAGVKGKVGEALAHGVPLVSTSIGTEGLGLVPGRDVAQADDARSFADRVVELLEDDETWEAMRSAGLILIDSSQGPERMAVSVDELLGAVDELRR